MAAITTGFPPQAEGGGRPPTGQPRELNLRVPAEISLARSRLSIPSFCRRSARCHRKKVDIGHALAEEVRRRTGEETMVSDLTYDLRSREPDSIDQLVAITFANIALDLIHDEVTGRMVAVQNGCYAHTVLPASSLGPRKVDVAMLYNANRYRPHSTSKMAWPARFK